MAPGSLPRCRLDLGGFGSWTRRFTSSRRLRMDL
jgi:hypothetical protein